MVKAFCAAPQACKRRPVCCVGPCSVAALWSVGIRSWGKTQHIALESILPDQITGENESLCALLFIPMYSVNIFKYIIFDPFFQCAARDLIYSRVKRRHIFTYPSSLFFSLIIPILTFAVAVIRMNAKLNSSLDCAKPPHMRRFCRALLLTPAQTNQILQAGRSRSPSYQPAHLRRTKQAPVLISVNTYFVH